MPHFVRLVLMKPMHHEYLDALPLNRFVHISETLHLCCLVNRKLFKAEMSLGCSAIAKPLKSYIYIELNA